MTKQETDLGMIDKIIRDRIKEKEDELKGATDNIYIKMTKAKIIVLESIRQELKSQLANYFKNEKIKLEKEYNNKIKEIKECRRICKSTEEGLGTDIQETYIKILKSKLTQLEKTEKDILGGEKTLGKNKKNEI